jgi:hypothetical protein
MDKRMIFGVVLVAGAAIALSRKKETDAPNGASSTTATSAMPSGDYDFRTTNQNIVRAVRNNNPGNVKSPGAIDWKGTVGYDDHRPLPHAIFSNYVYGTRAMLLDVQNKIRRGLNTTGKIIPVYCPKSDGCKTQEYLDAIEKVGNIKPNIKLDPNNKGTMFMLCKGIAYHEAGYDSAGANRTKFNQDIFNKAWNMLMIAGINGAKKRVSSIGATKKTKWFPVYEDLTQRNGNGYTVKNGKTNLAFLKNKSGVYLIKEGDEIIYVGSASTNLYSTILRHFQKWRDRPGRLTYKDDLWLNHKIRVFLCAPTKAYELEKKFIQHYRPRDNKNYYDSEFDDFSKREIDKDVKEIIRQSKEIVPF